MLLITNYKINKQGYTKAFTIGGAELNLQNENQSTSLKNKINTRRRLQAFAVINGEKMITATNPIIVTKTTNTRYQ